MSSDNLGDCLEKQYVCFSLLFSLSLSLSVSECYRVVVWSVSDRRGVLSVRWPASDHSGQHGACACV